MKYYLFIDESGDHGLSKIDVDFAVFLLCGIVINETEYENLRINLNEIKNSFWRNKQVIFHSRDIRKWQNEFQILINPQVREDFYTQLNSLIATNNYTILASAINKLEYIKTYGKLSDDVYEIALSFIIERAVFYLDSISEDRKSVV